MTDDISSVLFELASADRLALLSQISTHKQRLTSLSKFLNCTAQECSHHLRRLSDSGFIRKGSEGLYETTALGRAMQSLFPSIKFLIEHKDNFLSHDLSFLPQGFIERIGELAGGQYVNNISLVLKHIDTVISEAREYVWLMSDQPIVSGESIGQNLLARNVLVKLIGEQTIERKEFIDAKSMLKERIEIGTLQDVKFAMAINEVVAGVCFPDLNGKIDFRVGFVAKDLRFRSWCTDLFEHYWTRSRKIVSY